MKEGIIILFTCCLSHVVLSQPAFREGYIIKNEGDTIPGLVYYEQGREAYQSCKFRFPGTKEEIIFSPVEISGYGFWNDMVFESKKFPDGSEEEFFQVLVYGKISLFKTRGTYYVEKNDTIFLELKNDRQFRVKKGLEIRKFSKRYLGLLISLMADCSSIKEQIQATNYNERELQKLVETYNQCVGANYRPFMKKKPWVDISVGLAVGIRKTMLAFSTFDDVAFGILENNDYFDNSIVASLTTELSSPRFYENLSILVNFQYTTYQFSSFTFSDKDFVTTKNYIAIESSEFKIPFGVRYTFFGDRFSPYVNLGLSYTNNFESSTSHLEERKLGNTIYTYKDSAVELKDTQSGYWGGMGVELKITSGLNGFVEFIYEKTNGLVNSQIYKPRELSSGIDNYSLVMGINF